MQKRQIQGIEEGDDFYAENVDPYSDIQVQECIPRIQGHNKCFGYVWSQ